MKLPSVNFPRKYIAGAVMGAMAATGLVVLGASLGSGDPATRVELSSEEVEAAPADETQIADAAVTTSSAASSAPSTSAPTPAERVIVVERRVGDVEKRVEKIEATTTSTLDPCSATHYQVDANGNCHSLSHIGPRPHPWCEDAGSLGWDCLKNNPTTTTTMTVVTTPPAAEPATPPDWAWTVTWTPGDPELGTGRLTVTATNNGGPDDSRPEMAAFEVKYLEGARAENRGRTSQTYFAQPNGSDGTYTATIHLSGIESVGQPVVTTSPPADGIFLALK